MSKKIFIISAFIAVISVLCLVFFVKVNSSYAQQTGGCAPRDPSVRGWVRGTPVYYSISGLPQDVADAVIRAFNEWNGANGRNGSRVSFQPSDAQHPAVFTVGLGNSNTNPGLTQVGVIRGGNGDTVSAATGLSINNTTFFNQNNRNEFLEAVYRVMLHEIGHTMGLDDVPSDPTKPCLGQTAGQSVMNGMCGTNDQGGNYPGIVTACDNDSVSNNPQYATPTPSPTPGGGDDGCPCGDCINYCCNPGSANSDETESTANLNECGGGGDDDECGWVEVPGQCYGGVAYGDCWDGYGSFDKYRDNCQYDPPHCDPDQNIWYCP